MKSFTRPEKGTHPDVDAAVPHFDKEAHAERKPITQWAVQVKGTETAESFGINVKAGRDGCNIRGLWRTVTQGSNIHLSRDYS
jgi:hypothetical protein